MSVRGLTGLERVPLAEGPGLDTGDEVLDDLARTFGGGEVLAREELSLLEDRHLDCAGTAHGTVTTQKKAALGRREVMDHAAVAT